MSESKGTYYLDLSDRILLAQEGIEMIDISIERMAVKMIKQGADPEDENFVDSLMHGQIEAYAKMVKRWSLDDEEPADLLTMLMHHDYNEWEEEGEE
jgi:UDP-glucose 6-dehydrogenase